jgi:ParB/RepB/Spo0J family partition protein
MLLVSLLDPNAAQAARHLDEERRRLTESIRQHGVLQPPGVVKCGERYRVIWGNGRVVCAVEAGLKEIPCVVLAKPMTEREHLTLMWVENRRRNDWKPWELIDHLVSLAATGMQQQEMATELGEDPGTVSGYLTIHRKGIPALQEALRGGLAATTAMRIARLDPQEQQVELANVQNGAKRADVKPKGRKPKSDETERVKVKRLKIEVPGGMTWTLAKKGEDQVSVDMAATAAVDLGRVLKRCQSEGIGADNAQKISPEWARAEEAKRRAEDTKAGT